MCWSEKGDWKFRLQEMWRDIGETVEHDKSHVMKQLSLGRAVSSCTEEDFL